jgi:hypothetical protein
MPRRRPDPFEVRGRQLQQEAADRRQQEAILTRNESEVVEKMDNLPTSSETSPHFDYNNLSTQLRASQWVQQRFAGLGERSQRRLAEQVLHAMQNGDTTTLSRLNSKARRSTFNPHWALMGADYSPGMQLIPKPW